MDSIKRELWLESARVEEDCEYSYKSHFEAAGLWTRVHYWIGIPSAVLAAIAGISAFDERTIVAGILAILVSALGSLATFLNPSGKATEHTNSGNSYLLIRNRARIFRNIELESVELDEARQKLLLLAEKKDELNTTSPQIPEWAFKKAKSNIQEGQTKYRVDDA